MSIKYFPFDSTFTGVDADGIPQGDRGATSADWAAYIGRMFTDGYFRLLDDQLTPSVSETPMAVDIASGAAMIKGRQYSQDAPVTVSLGLSSSQPRIDRIVLRMSTEAADRKISLVVIKGTPASSPTAPAITRTASVYDICLAQISVGANAIQIVADNLTDTRSDDALCGYVKILLDGKYYPDATIPALLWVYTMYPDTLTTEQKAVVEGNTELMDIYNASMFQKPTWELLVEHKVAGTYEFDPENYGLTEDDEIGAYIIGGGASGESITGAGTNVRTAFGGASGISKAFVDSVPATPQTVVVGAGGAGVVATTEYGGNGNNGASSSFLLRVAEGGQYLAGSGYIKGGQCPNSLHYRYDDFYAPYGGVSAIANQYVGGTFEEFNKQIYSPAIDPFEDNPENVYLGAGGGLISGTTYYYETAPTRPTGKAGDAAYSASGNVTGGSATCPGDGGGAAAGAGGVTVTSGSGAAGMVRIYRRRKG